MIRIEQGMSCPVYAVLKMRETGEAVTPRVVSEVEICAGKQLSKRYSADQVFYDSGVKQWYFVPTQEETAAMNPGKHAVTIRVKFRNGQWSSVAGAYAGSIVILEKGSCKVCVTPAGSFADPVTDTLLAEFSGMLQYGIQGDPGKSAYQYAVEGGYAGTEAEFIKKTCNRLLRRRRP